MLASASTTDTAWRLGKDMVILAKARIQMVWPHKDLAKTLCISFKHMIYTWRGRKRP